MVLVTEIEMDTRPVTGPADLLNSGYVGKVNHFSRPVDKDVERILGVGARHHFFAKVTEVGFPQLHTSGSVQCLIRLNKENAKYIYIELGQKYLCN